MLALLTGVRLIETMRNRYRKKFLIQRAYSVVETGRITLFRRMLKVGALAKMLYSISASRARVHFTLCYAAVNQLRGASESSLSK